MLVTKQPVLRRFWYPVMPSSRLDGEPVPFTLLGTDIVLWQSETGGPACLKGSLLPPDSETVARLYRGRSAGVRLSRLELSSGWDLRADSAA
jgi:hypothetical protein